MQSAARDLAVAVAVAATAVLCAFAGLAVGAGGEALGDVAWTLPLVLVYAPAGVLLVRQAPRLAVVFLAIALFSAFALLAGEQAGAVADGRSRALGHVAVWASSWTWVPAYALLLGVLPHLLPDGCPAPGRSRHGLRLGLAAVVVGTVGWLLAPYDELDEPSDAAVALGARNPVGIDGAGLLIALGGVLLVLAAVMGLAVLALRWHRAGSLERRQLRWVLAGALASALLFAAARATPGGSAVVLGLAVLPLPLTVLVAVLRHGLWDPERALRPLLVWLALSSLLAAGFVAVVALLAGALGARAGAPVVAAALVALVVAPLRDRLQDAVGRLLHGGAVDPYDAVRALGDRLAAVTTPAEALAQAAQGVAEALRLPAVRLAVQDGPVAEHGDAALLDDPALVLPLSHAGAVVGELAAASGRSLRRRDRELLGLLASQAGAVASAAHAEVHLVRARARLAVVQEEERRRLRHDLHDSLGPMLAGVALQLEGLAGADPQVARTAERLTARVQEAVAQVRRLVDGLGVDASLGLAEALRAQVDSFDAPALQSRLVVDADSLGELPAAVEAAAVRVVGEALANTARHADADLCSVEVRREDDALHVVVRDDGIGVQAARTAGRTGGSGVGLASMAAVAAELGGSCAVVDGPGGGTEVRLVLPVQP